MWNTQQLININWLFSFARFSVNWAQRLSTVFHQSPLKFYGLWKVLAKCLNLFFVFADSNQTRHRSSNEEFDAAPFPSSNLTDSDFSSIKEVEQIYPRKILEQSLHEDDLLYESEKNRSSGFQSTGNNNGPTDSSHIISLSL